MRIRKTLRLMAFVATIYNAGMIKSRTFEFVVVYPGFFGVTGRKAHSCRYHDDR